jgi:hypothetical protein
MRSDVHSAALRAAAKVAFSVAFIGGCAAEAVDADPATTPDGTEPATTAEADLSSKKTKKKTGTSSALPSGCHHEDASVPKLSCDQIVAAAFPTEGNYPGTKQNVSAEVKTCCAELLGDQDGGLPAHRWDCCANLPANPGQNIGIACTPWGPPVPPSMKRRAIAMPSLQAVA